MTSIAVIVEILRHELWAIVRTKRIIAYLGVYLGAAVVGALAYVSTLAEIERFAQGGQKAAGMGGLREQMLINPLLQKAMSFLMPGGDLVVADVFQNSLLMPPILWASLVFLPILILLASFDHLAADIESRALCYRLIRVSRWEWVVGKILAQVTLFSVLCILASMALVLVARSRLESLDLGHTFAGLLYVWGLLLPYGFCYVGIIAFASVLAGRPYTAFVVSLGLLFLLRAFYWTDVFSADGPYSPLRLLRFLSPATYHDGLWAAGFPGPWLSIVAYLGFAAVFVLLTVKALERRDL